MTCLVTGGAGFIGSHICDALIDANHSVICLDNLITGNKKNIRQLLTNKRFTFIEDDVLNLEKYQLRPDYIFHLASPASPPRYSKYPEETFLVNTYGTYLLLRLASKINCPFLFASTSEVYGDPKEHPQKESYWGHVNPIGPRACYDEAKRGGEALVFSFIRKRKVKARVVRIFNTYGPRMEKNDGRVITNFIWQALQDKPLTIYGTGKQTRSFCYISDMTKGIIKAAFEKKAIGEVINLGNPQETTILALAKLVGKILGKKLKYKFLELPIDDPTRRRPSIEKAKKILGWYPTVPLEEGLAETVEFIRQEYGL